MKSMKIKTANDNYNAKKEFTDALQSLSYTLSHWSVFQDFLDYSLLMFRWWDVKESMFDELRKRYPKPEQHKDFAKAFYAMSIMAQGGNHISNGLETDEVIGFQDPFGDYFMEHFSSDRAGQFFTPQHLCDLKAIMLMGNIEDGQSVCDPAVGSGRCLLSAAKIARKAGKQLKYYSSDIDITCCKMTVLNMLMNSMPGEVAHMNTLTMEHWKSWKITLIPTFNGPPLPMYIELPAGHSQMIVKFKATFEELNQPKPLPEFKKPPFGNSSQISLFT